MDGDGGDGGGGGAEHITGHVAHSLMHSKPPAGTPPLGSSAIARENTNNPIVTHLDSQIYASLLTYRRK